MSRQQPPQLKTLRYPAGMLNLEDTLANGQMFRWRQTAEGWWDAVSADRMLRIRKEESSSEVLDEFEYWVLPEEKDEGGRTKEEAGNSSFVEAFFRLDVELGSIYDAWLEADPYLGSLTERFRGLRIVKQDPEECLLSFICSTANFIPRIMKAVGILAKTWGEPIADANGKVWTHSFPRAGVLARLDANEVAEKTGLEWRAANLIKVARQLAERPEGWLDEVAQLDYAQARGELTRLDGVGPKIADCVCLFAMKKDQAVPVDTHVWQLTRDRYMPNMKGKSLTSAAYAQVLNFYQAKFVKAGWAQQYLFYDHLLESRARRRVKEEG